MYDLEFEKFNALSRLVDNKYQLKQSHTTIFFTVYILRTPTLLEWYRFNAYIIEEMIRISKIDCSDAKKQYEYDYLFKKFDRSIDKYIGNMSFGVSRKGFYIHYKIQLSKRYGDMDYKTYRIKSYEEYLKHVNGEYLEDTWYFVWHSDWFKRKNLDPKKDYEGIGFLMDQM